MADNIVKARDLKAGDAVTIPPHAQVEIVEATPDTLQGIPCIHVEGVTPFGDTLAFNFSPESTFRWLRLAYDQEDES